MFKSKKEFAQALMDGREFSVYGGEYDRCFYDEEKTNPFRFFNGITMLLFWPIGTK